MLKNSFRLLTQRFVQTSVVHDPSTIAHSVTAHTKANRTESSATFDQGMYTLLGSQIITFLYFESDVRLIS